MMRRAALRVLALVVSLAILAAVLSHADVRGMRDALVSARAMAPVVCALEGAIIACNGLALAALYRAAGAEVPSAARWRAVLVGHAMAVCLPLGRLVAEAWKAARLARWSGAANAAASAVSLQAAVLLANAAIALAAIVGVALRCGAAWPTLAVGAFALVMVALGGVMVVLGRARTGRWLGARMASAAAKGAAFDEAFLRASRRVGTATVFEALARVAMLGQVACLRAALHRDVTVVDALATQGLVLAGAAVGEALPAQLGSTDATLAAAGARVGLDVSSALALTLALHGAQIVTALLGAGAALALREPAEAA